VSGREEMLERIRQALGRGGRSSRASVGPGAMPSPELVGIMPVIAPEESVPKFEAELAKLSGSVYRAPGERELEDILRKILDSSQTMSVALSRNPLLGRLGLAGKIRSWGKSVSVWPALGAENGEDDAEAMRDLAGTSFLAGVGITGVDFAVTETGSLVLSSLTEGTQMASLAPPVHVALYRRRQVLCSLDEVLGKLPVSRDPNEASPARSVVFITGASRTADIEQILIRGVHGPREVHAILVEESCLIGEGSTLP
jgi:L-lactate dehydrogenase complex protein LldG